MSPGPSDTAGQASYVTERQCQVAPTVNRMMLFVLVPLESVASDPKLSWPSEMIAYGAQAPYAYTGGFFVEPEGRMDPLRDHPRFQALLEKYE